MPVNDSTHVRQSDPGPLEFIRAMQALKHTEEFAGILRVKSHAVVSDKKQRLPPFRPAADLNFSLGTRPGILHRITDQIHPNLTQHRFISFYDRQRTDNPTDLAALNLRLQISDHLLDELIQIHFSEMHLALRHS